jgi:hypothetical protein
VSECAVDLLGQKKTSGGLLWKWGWIFMSHERQISLQTEWLVASED